MTWALLALAGIAVLFVLFSVGCSMPGEDTPPTPNEWVTQYDVNLLTADAVGKLTEQLSAYEKQTGHQVIVWIGRSTHGEAIEDFCLRAFNAWGIGREEQNDGVILFVFVDDYYRRIQVGYGLESALTDAECVRIITGQIVPKFDLGLYDQGVKDGVAAILTQLGN